ncbi:MAG: RNA 2',3'-cyclic phosphodiesterase [Bacteroidales bacterium]|nr:RNA 2',3'-cyclic phosphodiesterase [Bacteroidales bacterium]
MKKIFLAIKIPQDIILDVMVDEIQHNFNFMNVRWIEPPYLHMTLKFFGPTNERKISDITKELEKLFSGKQKFEIEINRLAMFGSKGAPKVLWLGIKEEEKIKELVKEIQQALDKLGLYADRQNFVPHISLGRIIKTNSNKFFQKQLKKYKTIGSSAMQVKSIVLLESLIGNKGVSYEVIDEYLLT